MKNVAKMTTFTNKFQVSEPSPKLQSRFNWNPNAQLAEYRTGEHHEERVGTNTL